MRFLNVVVRTLVILMLLAVSACSTPATPTPEPAAVVSEDPPTPESTEKEYEDFNPKNFDQSATIDNQWFPLTPGTQFIYDGVTVEEGKSIPHQIVITVTDLTKVIGGVRSVTTWDRDFSDGELVEAELAFFAQDKDGMVWRMGEYPEEYEKGEFVVAPTWVHGFQDARAGIAMQVNPQVGTPSYSQGWGPAVGWTDRGQVDQMNPKVCVPVKCYENVLVIAETSKTEAGAYQLKYFASGVGNIRTDWKGTDVTQETLELTKIVQLNPAELAEARAEAIKLETHAYEVSTDMYVQTSPVEYPEGTPAFTVEAVPTPQANVNAPGGELAEIVVYAADLPRSALSELDFVDDPASPSGKLLGLPNEGDELDPPPENDPRATFKVQVQNGVPYRCWIHMKVGAPKGRSQANVFWVQLSDAVDKENQTILKPGSKSYLTAQGPQQEGWVWVGCDLAGSDSLIYFQTSGEITVRLQAGMEGVGFDQFLLSPVEFLAGPPSEAVVEK